jgi:hypothetical protein
MPTPFADLQKDMFKHNLTSAFKFIFFMLLFFTSLIHTTLTLSQEDRRLAAITVSTLAANTAAEANRSIDDPSWQKATAVTDFFEYQPRERRSDYRTAARVLLSKGVLYILVESFDNQASRINATPARRDQSVDGQDFVTLYIDPIGSRKFAQIFRVNAAGAIADGLFNENTQDEDFAPDFEWTAKSTITATGWTAEFRIPLSTLRYTKPTPKTWSLLVVRGFTRDATYRLANARVPAERNCLMCYAQSLDGMGDVQASRELMVTPNVTFRTTRANDQGNETIQKREFISSLDIKYRPTSDLVFDATINPDFSQVELDTPQLAANAQFALFQQEKRPFFLEGTDILSSLQREIYTRSITDPKWGARLTKRSDGGDFSLLTVRDEGGGFILIPGPYRTRFALQDTASQATIARGRLNFDAMTLSATLTDRRYDNTNDNRRMNNRLLGTDMVWRPRNELRVETGVSVSDTRDERNYALGSTERDGNVSFINTEWQGPEWNYYGSYSQRSNDFRADNGFTTQAGTRDTYQAIRRTFRNAGNFAAISPYFNLLRRRDFAGNRVFEFNQAGISFSGQKHNMSIELRPEQKVRYRQEGPTWDRSQVYLTADGAPGTWLANYSIQASIGDRGDVANNRIGRGYIINASAKLRLAERLTIEPRIDESVVNSKQAVVGSSIILRERAVQINSVYNFTSRDDLRAILQYNGVRRAPSLYQFPIAPFTKTETVSIVYGHRRSVGTSFYVGFNSSRTQTPQDGINQRNNEFFVKASIAFDLFSL